MRNAKDLRRRGGGTLRAADQAQHFLRTAPPGSYVLKLDIRKYYYSIPHGTLRSALARKIHDKRLLDLCIAFTAPGDRGLCVGSTLAQLFGLVYLGRLDEYCKRVLKLKRYVRYVDDILIIGETKERCRALKAHLEQWLHETLDLELSHWSISPVRRGVNFCGYKATARTRVIRPRSLKTFKRALKRRFWPGVDSVMAHALPSATYSKMISLVAERADGAPAFITRRLSKWLSTHTSPTPTAAPTAPQSPSVQARLKPASLRCSETPGTSGAMARSPIRIHASD